MELYRFEAGTPVIEALNGAAAGGLPAGYSSRPARPGVHAGAVHGTVYYQYDFTEAQYQALERLLLALVRVLPRIEPRVPRAADGSIIWTALGDGARDFRGVLGHYHFTTEKQDPGPAFDWERIARALVREVP
jgi:hypothetical protein